MSIAQIIKGFNAGNMITGKDLTALLNDVVSNNASIRVLDGRTKEVRLVKPDDIMPLCYRMTGVYQSSEESKDPDARVAFAMFGTCGFITYSNDPFQILKEVEELKAAEGNAEVQFSKGIEIKVSKDLVKLTEKVFKKHQQKALVMFTKEDAKYIQEKAEKKLKILGSDKSFYITSETEEYHAIMIDGTFCKAIVKAVDEVADSAIDIAITVKTAMMAMVVAANKARDDIKRVIKSIKK